MRTLGRFLALLIALQASALAARPLAPAEAEARFVVDAAEHRLASQRVGATRGFSIAAKMDAWNQGAAATIEGVAAALRSQRGASFTAGTAVLFYAQRDDALAVYLIGPAGLLAADASPVTSAQLTLAADRMRASLGVEAAAALRSARLRDMPPFKGQERKSYDTDARVLARLLLPAPITSRLAGVTDLIVVGDGAIGAVPFAALPLAQGRLIVDAMSVSIAAGLYDISRSVPPWPGAAAFRRALVVGNPLVPASRRWQVPPLPGAEAEARKVSATYGVTPLLGAAATKVAVSEAAPAAAVLYIAAHGAADPQAPLTGGLLMLSGPDEASAFWTAGEIQQQHFDAALAVLSACQSGLGHNAAGGTIGLARAFHLAGVPRVVMSLWSVDDAATLFLMTRFSAHAAQERPAEALRRAMLEARAQNDDPSLWAPFALFGTPR